MTAPREWDLLEQRWRAARTSSAELDAMIERAIQARRSIVAVQILSTAMAIVALAVVAAALKHAGNILETALGAIVGTGIARVWFMDALNRRDAAEKVEAPADEYRAARRALCARRMRFARLSWIVVGLDLVFLIPWWIGGFAVHGAGFHPAQIATIWAPLVLMAGFVAWTFRLHRRARRERDQLLLVTRE
jgi:hypothetical protein